MQLFNKIQDALIEYSGRNAFFINGVFYKYADLAAAISKIRKAIQSSVAENERNIGLVANDDLETYAAIFALWFEGKAYIPISPETPKNRNDNIIKQALIKTFIDSSVEPLFSGSNSIESKKLPEHTINERPKNSSDQELVYILFTSGTTGQPKGVPITRENLTGFINAFNNLGLIINEKDRCLQMFELTFDLSVMSYLVPLLTGACVYTIPKDKIKYSYIFELMDEQKLTVSLMVPSMLHYLRPYFNEINVPEMKYSLFCGEALPLDVTEEWSKCVPNATIHNVYGPTEDTIFCTEYVYSKNGNNKTHNGVLSIGKAMKGNFTVVVDEQNRLLPYGNTGQLCLAGMQLTPGYWHNEEKNKEVFFTAQHNGLQTRFYKTGDLCYVDEEGDILYIGRSDNQIKVQGFRVELSEIEFHVKAFLGKLNAVAVAITDALGNTEIGLIIESHAFDITALQEYMKTKMQAYMIPKKIEFTSEFPLNANGKTDRNLLKQRIYDLKP
jgi:D-alanine--poly(phosphoribitol) ligase subunit 1